MAQDLILFLQGVKNPVLDLLFGVFLFLAQPETAAVLILAVYWCLDKRAGRKLGLVVVSGSLLNNGVKNILRIERPFVQNPEIAPEKLETATGYSFPSGHTQNAATTGLTLALFSKRRVYCALAVFVALMAGMSRMYHGVHSLYDVLGGLVLGLGWAVLASWAYDRAEKQPVWYLLFLLPILLNLLGFFPFWSERPVLWHDSITTLGLMLGLGVGFYLEERFVHFRTDDGGRKKLLRVAVGAVGAGAILLLFQFLPAPEWMRLLKYTVFALWAAYGAPALVEKLPARDRR